MTPSEDPTKLPPEIAINVPTEPVARYEALRSTNGQIVDFRLALLTDPARQLWQYPQADPTGLLLSELYTHRDAQFLIRQFALVADTGRSVRIGETFHWLQGEAAQHGALLISAGEDGVWVHYGPDTDQLVAENSTKQQALFVETVLNSVTCGVVVGQAVRGPQGQIEDILITSVNAQAAAMAGYTVDDMVGQLNGQLFPGIYESGVFDFYVHTIESGEPQTHELQYNHDGFAVWAHLQTTKLGDGLVITCTDVSERRRIEKTLQQRTALLESIQNSSQIGISSYNAIRNEAGQIIDFQPFFRNEVSARMANLPPHKATAQTMVELLSSSVRLPADISLSPAERDALVWESPFFKIYSQVVETGVSSQLEQTVFVAGVEKSFEIAVSAWQDGIVVNALDMTELRRAERKQIKQAAFTETVLDTITTAVAAYDAVRDADGRLVDFRFTLVNRAFLKQAGRSEAEVVGYLLTDLFPGTLQSGTFNQFRAALETGQAQRFELRYDYDGLNVWVLGAVSPFGGGVVASSIDITQQKQAEWQVQQQAGLLRSIQKTTQTGISTMKAIRDATGQVVDFEIIFRNKMAGQLTGRPWTADSVSSLLGTYPGEQTQAMISNYATIIETGQPQLFEYFYKDDTVEGWFEVVANPWADGIVTELTETTQQRRAERKQIEQAAFTETVLDTITTAVAAYDAVRDAEGRLVDFRFTLVNKAFLKQVSRSEAEVVGCRLTDLFPGTLQSGTFNQLRLALETGQLQRRETHYPHDGLDIWVASSVMPSGNGIVVSTVDITAMREQQQQLEKLNLELKRSNESLDSFAYIASHDLQEPLRKMTSFTDILHRQYAGQFDANASDILQRINASAERMKLLIQDLLAYSRIDAKLAAFKPVDLMKLLRELEEEDLWASLRQHKGSIVLNGLPTLMADPLLMRQLFQNLLTNALKFCRPGVAPVVKVSSRLINRSDLPAELPIADQLNATPTFYELAVADNGIGFDPKYLDRIFQVFQRLNGRTQYLGSGIGLSICQKIVERHGGAITARSVPGEGSIFVVYWPVTPVGFRSESLQPSGFNKAQE